MLELAPNILSVSRVLDQGGVVTVLKPNGGDTSPRLVLEMTPGRPVDVGAVDNPERFGPYTTAEQFNAWAEKFLAA